LSSREAGSYRIGEARYRDAAAELARLQAQAEAAWPSEARTLERHGLREDAAVLEAGCGPGFVTARLLACVPQGSVTALDFDPAMVAHARDLVGASERVQFVEGSAAATGLPGRSFDIVVARFLLQHLPDITAALSEFRRVLRPGGRLIVVDADNAFTFLFDPEPPFYSGLMAAVEEAQRLHGSEPKIGRRLPRLLADAGFSDLEVDVVVAHSVLVGRETIARVIPVQVLEGMEESGIVPPDLAATARDFFTRLDSADAANDAMMSFVVVSGST
jgi:ubiquinone/menaquinone biosynthesis C-methylase UbiE